MSAASIDVYYNERERVEDASWMQLWGWLRGRKKVSYLDEQLAALNEEMCSGHHLVLRLYTVQLPESERERDQFVQRLKPKTFLNRHYTSLLSTCSNDIYGSMWRLHLEEEVGHIDVALPALIAKLVSRKPTPKNNARLSAILMHLKVSLLSHAHAHLAPTSLPLSEPNQVCFHHTTRHRHTLTWHQMDARAGIRSFYILFLFLSTL